MNERRYHLGRRMRSMLDLAGSLEKGRKEKSYSPFFNLEISLFQF